MKKNTPYFILLVVLIGVAILLYLDHLPKVDEDKDFAISDIEQIHAINIEDKSGNRVKIQKRDGVWYIGKYPAQKSLIIPILEAVSKWRVELPISQDLRKRAIDELRRMGIKIKFEDESGDEIKTVHIAGQYKDFGNFMILEKSGIVMNNPYVVKFPAFKGNLNYRFLTDSVLWRSTEFVALQPMDIARVSLTYIDKPQLSYVLTKDEELVKVDPIHDSLKIKKPLNKERVVNFLLAFSELHIDKYILDDSTISNIQALPSFAQLKVTDIEGIVSTMNLYKMPSNVHNPHLDIKGKPLPYNIDYFYGYNAEKKYYCILQFYNFGPILKDYQYFFSN